MGPPPSKQPHTEKGPPFLCPCPVQFPHCLTLPSPPVKTPPHLFQETWLSLPHQQKISFPLRLPPAFFFGVEKGTRVGPDRPPPGVSLNVSSKLKDPGFSPFSASPPTSLLPPCNHHPSPPLFVPHLEPRQAKYAAGGTKISHVGVFLNPLYPVPLPLLRPRSVGFLFFSFRFPPFVLRHPEAGPGCVFFFPIQKGWKNIQIFRI